MDVAWAGRGSSVARGAPQSPIGHPGSAGAPAPPVVRALCSVQPATRVHVYMCICDFPLDLFLCFCKSVPKMLRLAGGEQWPTPTPGGDRSHSS